MKNLNIKHKIIIILYLFTNIQMNIAQPIWSWMKNFGGVKDEYSACLKVDFNGNIFIAGSFESPTLSFGSSVLNLGLNSKKDIFLAKINSNGNVLWAKSAGAKDIQNDCKNNYNYVNCITVDNSGNCYIAGMFKSDTLSFSSSVQLVKACEPSDANIFIAKYDPNGNVLWAKQFGGSNWDKATGISLDNAGNIILTGCFWSNSISFGSNVLYNSGGVNSFVVKLNSSGNVIWAKGSTGNLSNYASCITVDNNNNIIIGGTFISDSVSFGNQTLINSGKGDIFLVKYDANGVVQWAKSANGENNDELYALNVDNLGNLYITGRFVT